MASTTQDGQSEQEAVRRAKLDRLRDGGVDPYPVGVRRTTTNAELRDRFPDLAPDTATGEQVSVVGRVMRRRDGGRLCFATLRDGTADLQVMLSLDRVGEERLEAWRRDVDLGDHVSVDGEVVSSRRGELSVMAASWTMASKSLRPLPEKWHGLADEEARVRQRYLDLLVNPDARRLVEARATVLRSLRATLDRHGFLEVETPMLQTRARRRGGATLRHAAERFRRPGLPADRDRALAQAAGGRWVERVYEIGRNFRNEGVDTTHSPEFTMLEAYQAYGDYNTIAELTRTLVLDAARALGSTVVPRLGGGELELDQPWPRLPVYEAVSAAAARQITPDTSREELLEVTAVKNVSVRPGMGGAGDRARAARAAGGAHSGRADVPLRLPGGGAPAGAAPPRRSEAVRGMGPRRQRRRARAGLLRARRPGRAAQTAHRAVGEGGRRRPGGDGSSTRTSCVPSSTARRRWVVWAWGSTGC